MMRAVIASCVLLVAGCEEAVEVRPDSNTSVTPETAPADWPIYRGTPALPGVATGPVTRTPSLLWTYKTEGPIVSSPVVVDGVVYFGSSDQALHAVDLATGERRWAFATEDMIDAPPLVIDGVVYIGSADFFFYAVDAESGELRWKYETQDKILGGANHVRLADGSLRIVVGSYDSKLYGFDVDGNVLWTYETGNYVNGTPAVHGEHVIFGGCDAFLHVVAAADGAQVAQIDLGEGCHVAGSAAIEGDRVYVGHYGNEFVCFEIESKELVWAYPSRRHAFFSAAAIGADRVIFGGRDKQVHCVRKSDGEALWTFKTRRKVDSSPLLCDDVVLVGSGDGRLYMLSADTGEELWSYDLGRPVFSSPAVVDGKILIGSDDGSLYVFGEGEGG